MGQQQILEMKLDQLETTSEIKEQRRLENKLMKKNMEIRTVSEDHHYPNKTDTLKDLWKEYSDIKEEIESRFSKEAAARIIETVDARPEVKFQKSEELAMEQKLAQLRSDHEHAMQRRQTEEDQKGFVGKAMSY